MSVLAIKKPLEEEIPLVPGDRLDQKTFHRRYEAMPEGTRAELIGGVVYMTPPTGGVHSGQHPYLITWLTLYEMATAGPPELVAEVSSSTESIDLHEKRADYERHGVGEYVALLVGAQRVIWFIHKGKKFVEMQPAKDGILRSRIFPGLWLDPDALLAGDMRRVQEVLNQGLATPEHAAFAAPLKK